MRLRGNLKSRSKAWYHDSIQESLMERTVNYMHGEIKKKKLLLSRTTTCVSSENPGIEIDLVEMLITVLTSHISTFCWNMLPVTRSILQKRLHYTPNPNNRLKFLWILYSTPEVRFFSRFQNHSNSHSLPTSNAAIVPASGFISSIRWPIRLNALLSGSQKHILTVYFASVSWD